MACHLFGGERGAMHDSRLLRESKLLDQLQTKNQQFHTGNYVLYADSGYFAHELLKKPFSKAEIMADHRKDGVNKRMSKVRITVEWFFNLIIQKFAFLDKKRQMKLFEKPINMLYGTAVILLS